MVPGQLRRAGQWKGMMILNTERMLILSQRRKVLPQAVRALQTVVQPTIMPPREGVAAASLAILTNKLLPRTSLCASEYTGTTGLTTLLKFYQLPRLQTLPLHLTPKCSLIRIARHTSYTLKNAGESEFLHPLNGLPPLLGVGWNKRGMTRLIASIISLRKI